MSGVSSKRDSIVGEMVQILYYDTHPSAVKKRIIEFAQTHVDATDEEMVQMLEKQTFPGLGWGELFYFRTLVKDNVLWNRLGMHLIKFVDSSALKWGGLQRYNECKKTNNFVDLRNVK